MIHLCASQADAHILKAALNLKEEDIWHPQDNLCDGPLSTSENQSFDELRKNYAISINKHLTSEEGYNDVASLMHISSRFSNDATIQGTYWIAPSAHNIISYFFVLHHLRKHLDRIKIINISGLPFLDADGKLFFPKTISQLSEKEIQKCHKLSRNLSPSEIEIDSDEWKTIRNNSEKLRSLEGTKKIISLPENKYDELIKSSINEGKKPARTAQNLITKHGIEASPEFLIHRISILMGEKIIESESTE